MRLTKAALLVIPTVIATTIVTPTVSAAPVATIASIQGTGFLSSRNGENVTGVVGVVTATRSTGISKGLWIQSSTPDDDPSTSDAIFVYTGKDQITVTPGDLVSINARVSEYRRLNTGESADTTANLSVTELVNPSITVTSRGNPLPAPLVIGPDTVPTTFAAPGDNVEKTTVLDPARSAQEFFEAHEGELVALDRPRLIAPSNSYGELFVTSKPNQDNTIRGGALLSSYNLPTGRLEVIPASGAKPTANTGDEFDGVLSGPLDWQPIGGYFVAATSVPSISDKKLAPTVVPEATPDQLSVATYNVENLAPGDSSTKFTNLARGVVTNLRSPDVVVLEEIQDNSGASDDGVVAADRTISKLIDAIANNGGPRYQYRQIDPQNDTDGGKPGGNIRTVFLFNDSRVSFVDRGTPSWETPTVAENSPEGVRLTVSPGRIDPANDAWTTSRKPLVGQFAFAGRTVFVIGNHFNSKGGDQSADGRYQPPTRSSENQRVKQATVEHDWITNLLGLDSSASVVVAGDLNDYQFSLALSTLTGNGSTLTDLIGTLPSDQRYTYIYSGVSQVLDHIAVSNALRDTAQYHVLHINSEFAKQTSDHDPQVVRLRP